jgi:kynurenine formamidase
MSLASKTPPSASEYDAYKTRFRNWGRWGPGDQLGTLNHITKEGRVAAAGLVREGRSVSLGRPLHTAAALPAHRNRNAARHTVRVDAMGSSDELQFGFHGFAATHIDALCHIFTADGLMYNGRPASDVSSHGSASNGIEQWRDGIVTRGVLYDVPRHRGVEHVSVEEPVHGWEMMEIAAANGITPMAGDAVVVRAGADAFWRANPAFEPPWQAPGLHASVLEFLWETDAALLAWDLMEAPGQDAYDAPALPIHTVAIPYMGLALLDNIDAEPIAAACAESGRASFLLTVAPLMVTGGTGSPVNPIAIL